ncbi:nef attachable domain protein, partial [Chlamydia psittaci 03DC29]
DNSSHRVTAFPSRSLSLRLFLWNLQSDICKPLEGYGENEISSVKNWKETF